jgi:hypothetical protein
VKNEQVNGKPANEVSSHSDGPAGSNWSWAKVSFTTAPFVSTNPTELWLNPQTAKVTGLKIPPVPAGTTDYAAECNANVLGGDVNACGSAKPVTVSSTGTAKGSLSVVSGTVGDGTCGTSLADIICYIVLSNVPNGGGTATPIAMGPIDFYEGQ